MYVSSCIFKRRMFRICFDVQWTRAGVMKESQRTFKWALFAIVSIAKFLVSFCVAVEKSDFVAVSCL